LIGIEQIGPGPSSRLASPTPPVSTATQVASTLPQTSTDLQVRYRNANPAENSQDSKPEFIIKNSGSTPANLDNLELSYYFSDEGNQPFVFHCDWAAMGCANVIGEFESSLDGAQRLRIHFRPGLEPLPPGQDSGEIKVRFNRSDWSDFNQSDDYSFSPAYEYEDWERVTLAVNGQVVWGIEPGATVEQLPTGTTQPPTLAPTPSVPDRTSTPKQEPDETLPPTITSSPVEAPQPSNPTWRAWLVPGLAILIAFAIGFLVAAMWLGRRNR
jgi:hypothetical protein